MLLALVGVALSTRLIASRISSWQVVNTFRQHSTKSTAGVCARVMKLPAICPWNDCYLHVQTFHSPLNNCFSVRLAKRSLTKTGLVRCLNWLGQVSDRLGQMPEIMKEYKISVKQLTWSAHRHVHSTRSATMRCHRTPIANFAVTVTVVCCMHTLCIHYAYHTIRIPSFEARRPLPGAVH